MALLLQQGQTAGCGLSAPEKTVVMAGCPGIEEVRWRAPVRPDDTLTGTTTVVDAQPSSKDPTRGTVFIESAMTNQDGVVVMTMKSRGMFGRRKA